SRSFRTHSSSRASTVASSPMWSVRTSDGVWSEERAHSRTTETSCSRSIAPVSRAYRPRSRSRSAATPPANVDPPDETKENTFGAVPIAQPDREGTPPGFPADDKKLTSGPEGRDGPPPDDCHSG